MCVCVCVCVCLLWVCMYVGNCWGQKTQWYFYLQLYLILSFHYIVINLTFKSWLYVSGIVLSLLQVITHIILLTIPWSKSYYDLHFTTYKTESLGFPGGAVVENPPANAGDTGSSPGLGRSHMPRGNWARETQLLSLRVWSLCSATREAAIVRGPRTAMKSGPYLPQLEKALAQNRRPNTAKNK